MSYFKVVANSDHDPSAGWPGCFVLPSGWRQKSYEPATDMVTFEHVASGVQFQIQDLVVVANPREIEERLRELSAPSNN